MDILEFNLTIDSGNISIIANTSTKDDIETIESCYDEGKKTYRSTFGIDLAIPEWEAIVTVVVLSAIIVITVVGNILVILSVFTYKPLRIVQNFFIVSLAVADLTVAILVLPFNIAYSILGRWIFGISFCKLWLTCDILCCTSSILNLCSIALDRYWAITDPINYAQKRTMERVLLMIFGVWILSLIISSPPLLGWNDWPEELALDAPCQLTSQRGYVIYSSLGSFYIPLLIMTIVYFEIYLATRKRLRNRAKVSKINTTASKNPKTENILVEKMVQEEPESLSSETNHNEHPSVSDTEANTKMKERQNKKLKNVVSTLKSTTESFIEIDKVDETKDIQAIACPPKKPNIVYQFIEEKQKISLSKERKAARTLGIIMGVFVVCWLPFFMMYVILPFCPFCCPTNKFINFITWLGYINSTLNPVIYTIFNIDYRRAFKKLLGMSG